MTKHALDELDELFARSTARVQASMTDLAKSYLERDGDAQAPRRRLAKEIASQQALADMLGRRRLLIEADALRRARGDRFGAEVVQPLEFPEAIQDLVDRDPRLASGAEDVGRIYSLQHGFALARAAEQHVVELVQDKIAGLLQIGASADDARHVILAALKTSDPKKLEAAGISPEGLTAAYAETVYRTNVAQAYTAGRVEQSRDPDVQDVVGGWRYDAVGDSNTRPNHIAADGLVAKIDDPVWDTLAPPLGFNCRCVLAIALPFEVEDAKKDAMEAFRAGAHPDAGFLTTPRAVRPR